MYLMFNATAEHFCWISNIHNATMLKSLQKIGQIGTNPFSLKNAIISCLVLSTKKFLMYPEKNIEFELGILWYQLLSIK